MLLIDMGTDILNEIIDRLEDVTARSRLKRTCKRFDRFIPAMKMMYRGMEPAKIREQVNYCTQSVRTGEVYSTSFILVADYLSIISLECMRNNGTHVLVELIKEYALTNFDFAVLRSPQTFDFFDIGYETNPANPRIRRAINV